MSTDTTLQTQVCTDKQKNVGSHTHTHRCVRERAGEEIWHGVVKSCSLNKSTSSLFFNKMEDLCHSLPAEREHDLWVSGH